MATDLGITTRTLPRWRNAYRVRGLAGLAMQWATGRPPSLPATLAPTILAWVQQGPAGCGLDRATWTYAELATSLYQTQGLAVSETTMRMFCPKHGVRPYRPTYPDLKGDPEKQAGAPQEFDALKNS